jgi:CHAD domain-containing protein
MSRPEKWLPGVTAASKVRAVARKALAARFVRVARNLKRAVKESPDQADRIHKLRTWCRRSAAAVELFRPLLPKQEGKWFSRQLKKIRRAAGDVRNLDVMLEQTADPGTLAEELVRQRRKALKPLKRLCQQLLRGGKFGKHQRRLLRDILQPKKGLAEWSTRRVGQQAAALVALGERNLRPLEAVHEFRIACKELRYVLEIIGAALPLATVQVYGLLGDLQQRIGVICDHAAAAGMCQELLGKVGRSRQQPFRDAVAAATKEGARRERAFLRWWTAGRKRAFQKALVDAGLL